MVTAPFWRAAGGEEVDFIVESGRRLLPIEVKSSARLRPESYRGIEAFLGENRDQAPFGLMLYGGDEVVRVSERVAAIPLGILS